MFYKVVTLTLVLLVQITYQGKLMSRGNPMHIFNQSNVYFGHDKIRNARQFEYISKWFNKNDRIEHYKDPHPKSQFLEVMNYIMRTPDYGLKYTEDHQTRRFEFPSFPGFHNLIEVRGPTRHRFLPNKVKEYKMQRIQKQNKNMIYQVPPEASEHQPEKSKQLDEVDFSKEGFSIWEYSHESYKRSPGSESLNNLKPSTPMQKFYERRHYITKVFTTTAVAEVAEVAEVIVTPSNPNVVSFVAPDVLEKIDPLPFKQVKTRDQDSEEDEEDERSKYLEYY